MFIPFSLGTWWHKWPRDALKKKKQGFIQTALLVLECYLQKVGY